MTKKKQIALMKQYCKNQSDCNKCVYNVSDSPSPVCTIDTIHIEPKERVAELFDVLPEDMVNAPPHYNQGSIECIDAMIAAYGKEAIQTFCMVNAFKYLWRTQHKNGVEDVNKAIWYLNKYLELGGTNE